MTDESEYEGNNDISNTCNAEHITREGEAKSG